MDTGTLTQLLNGTDTGTGSASPLFDLSSLTSSLAPFILGSAVVTIVLVILYAISVISKWRANKAILDMKKILIEMNERDKLRVEILHPHDTPTPAPPAAPAETANGTSPATT